MLTDEGHEAISIRFITELLHQGLGLLLGQLLSEVGQETEQLVEMVETGARSASED